MNYNSESCPLTLNTTMICATDAIDTSIEVSKIGFANMKPKAVILVNEKETFDGIAATSLVHFPINASLLFTYGNSLRKETLDEIRRLSPKGYKGIHVIYVETADFQLVDSKFEGNIYFKDDAAKAGFKMDDTSSVTGKQEVQK